MTKPTKEKWETSVYWKGWEIDGVRYVKEEDVLGIIAEVRKEAIEEEREKVGKEILLMVCGELLKARMSFELNAGDGTGKDEMRIEDYQKLMKRIGDILKAKLKGEKGK